MTAVYNVKLWAFVQSVSSKHLKPSVHLEPGTSQSKNMPIVEYAQQQFYRSNYNADHIEQKISKKIKDMKSNFHAHKFQLSTCKYTFKILYDVL